ncbi:MULTISPECIES: hypothetical protein [Flavobacterium]|uniref:hypothetical protein n=1 Tax=Flavobacterium TaxID=237 RepID=UPI001FCC2637|nr:MULTISPECIES: hypothetical protein [Flavobacterium]UOK41634.1 hypothetical protein LZF87_09960 [Flavobacterium enshiense]
MKTKFFFIPLLLLFFACSKKIETSRSNEDSLTEVEEPRRPGKAFFDFDKVEHYSNDISESDAENLSIKDKPSKKESILSQLLTEDDMEYTDELEKYNFKKSVINSSKLDSINKIFSENPCKTVYVTACIPVYRDIFIFKKNEKIVGKAKVCFGCRSYSIEGTKLNTENFGQCGDFERLGKLIY